MALTGCHSATRTAESQASQAMARAQRMIASHRQGEAVIRVVDRDDRPVNGARLRITQAGHEFKFGCYLVFKELPVDRQPDYTAHFLRLFNYATVAFYWGSVESRRGEMYWDRADREVAWGVEHKLALKGHPLVWGAESIGPPKWLSRKPDELSAQLKQRVQETIGRYRGRITLWDVVNEPLEGGIFEEVLGDSYIKAAFEWAREADPAARLVINEYGIFSARSRKREPYLKLLERLVAEQTPFDAIGIQAHEPRTEWFDPAVVAETLDRYSHPGKPIHITEFTTQMADNRITGGYRQGQGRWTPERQAEYWREFFTICFGHPQVEAITVWGLDDARAWLAGGALLDEQWQPKPAYLALDQLINHQWRTRSTGVMAHGAFQMRGFYGDYEVEAETPDGTKITQRFALRRGAQNEWKIKCGKVR
jgi:GH35 family endo-1,4-beta-xylanase